MNQKLEDTYLLSLGTGRTTHYYSDPNNHDWGYRQWVTRLPSCLWDGMLLTTQLVCREMLGERYCKTEPIFETEISMDDPQQVPLLTEIAKKMDLREAEEWIEKFVM
jgi:hypothetical protein